MDEKHLSILKAAISHYSVTVAKVITMEEMAELTKEISKSIRYGDINTENIAEEMADVEICLEFLRLIYNNAERVKEYKSQKIDRLAERIKGGGR